MTDLSTGLGVAPAAPPFLRRLFTRLWVGRALRGVKPGAATSLTNPTGKSATTTDTINASARMCVCVCVCVCVCMRVNVCVGHLSQLDVCVCARQVLLPHPGTRVSCCRPRPASGTFPQTAGATPTTRRSLASVNLGGGGRSLGNQPVSDTTHSNANNFSRGICTKSLFTCKKDVHFSPRW